MEHDQSVERRDRQLAILSQTSRRINRVLEAPAILRTLVRSAMQLVGATAGTAGLLVDGRMHFDEYHAGERITPVDVSFDPGQGVPGWVMQTRQSYLANNAEADAHVLPELQRRLGFVNLAHVPILSRESELLGCLEMHNKEGGFDNQDVTMLEGLAASAAVALENARAVAELKRVSESLAEAEAKYRTLTEESVVGVYAIQDGRFVYCNARLAEIFGYSREELAGMTATELVAPEDRATVAENIRRREAGETNRIQYAFRGLRKDGGVIDVEVIGARSIYNGQAAIIGSLIEVTERRRAERDREQLLVREQAARAQAEAAIRSKDQFLAVVSHELRTPLTPVLAAVGLLERSEAIPESTRQLLSIIRRNVELETRIIDDLLDLTRITRGGLNLKLETIDAHLPVREALAICRRDIEQKGLRLNVDLAAARSHVRADPARLQQLFWNLLANAVKFTPSGGQIGIRSREAEGRMVIEVSDSGVGIDTDMMGRLFQTFQQGEQTLTRRFGGLGLGLSICKALAEAHGGHICAASEGRDKGAIFTVDMPLVAVQSPAEKIAAPGSPSRRLLLVEDNPDSLRMLARLLKSMGHEVQTATSVASAMEVASHGEFDLLISDIGLPDGSGWELLRRMREKRPVTGIAISGFGAGEDIARSREAGFVAHLVKPVNVQILEETIRSTE